MKFRGLQGADAIGAHAPYTQHGKVRDDEQYLPGVFFGRREREPRRNEGPPFPDAGATHKNRSRLRPVSTGEEVFINPREDVTGFSTAQLLQESVASGGRWDCPHLRVDLTGNLCSRPSHYLTPVSLRAQPGSYAFGKIFGTLR